MAACRSPRSRHRIAEGFAAILMGARVRIHRRDQELLRAALPLVNCTEDWEVFKQVAPTSGVQALIVFVRNLEKWPHLAELGQIRNRQGRVPVTLITEPIEANFAPLGMIEVDHLLFPSHLERLPSCMTRKRGASYRRQLAEKLRGNPRLSSHERALLGALLFADPPPRTISEWAKMAHVSLSTVKYHFRRQPGRSGLSARVAININLLLSGLDGEPGPASWDSLASAVDVDQRRLRASARALGLGSAHDVLPTEDLDDEIAKAIVSRLSWDD
jgi:hypothetical protein